MNTLTLSIHSQDDDNILLAGWIYTPADLLNPFINQRVDLKPSLASTLNFPPGVYYYRFNANVTGKFALAATSAGVPDQSKSFDIKADDQFHLSFRFMVST